MRRVCALHPLGGKGAGFRPAPGSVTLCLNCRFLYTYPPTNCRFLYTLWLGWMLGDRKRGYGDLYTPNNLLIVDFYTLC